MSSTATRRTDRLIVREVEGETVVYDLDNEQVTVLDARTAAVWHAVDGRTPVAHAARRLKMARDDVELAIARLAEAGLINNVGLSRRTLLKGLGGGAALVPLMTVMAPPAFAASSLPTKSISGVGTCNNGGNATVTVTGDGFALGTVTYTITYSRTQGNPPVTTSVSVQGTLTQTRTGTATGPTVTLNKVTPGTTTATITATDSRGNTVDGVVALTGCVS